MTRFLAGLCLVECWFSGPALDIHPVRCRAHDAFRAQPVPPSHSTSYEALIGNMNPSARRWQLIVTRSSCREILYFWARPDVLTAVGCRGSQLPGDALRQWEGDDWASILLWRVECDGSLGSTFRGVLLIDCCSRLAFRRCSL